MSDSDSYYWGRMEATICAMVQSRVSALFVPGVSPIPVSGITSGVEELLAGCQAVLDGNWAGRRWVDAFEAELAKVCGVRYACMTNSGSSANLLALAALTAEELEGLLKPGDEVITCAAGFPTTVNPIVQLGLVPVFVDVELGTYVMARAGADSAISDGARSMMAAHTLGNVAEFGYETTSAVEDCCDALGSLDSHGEPVGRFAHLSTYSFYPAHHITTGEGGAVLTDSPRLNKLVRSFRDWGRDCWCDPGKDNTCGKRFGWDLANLPSGYDHKYIYSRLGYNLKATEMQAAIGLAQLRKLPAFVEARRRNWQRLRDGLADLEEFFILPEATPGSKPSWFGFVLTVHPEAPFERSAIVRFLEGRKIATRPLFGGNLTKQPAYKDVKYRVVGDLKNEYVLGGRLPRHHGRDGGLHGGDVPRLYQRSLNAELRSGWSRQPVAGSF